MSSGWREGRFCLNCDKTYDHCLSKLLRCTYCYVAYYCSKNCQTADYPNHKTRCHTIKHLWEYSASLRMRYEAFQYPPLPWDEETQYLLGTGEALAQWEMVSRTQWDDMDYPKTRFLLSKEILSFAREHKCANVFEKVLKYNLESLTLNHRDVLGVRFITPFFLLSMHKDSDAYNFIKWWTNDQYNLEYKWHTLPQFDESPEKFFAALPKHNMYKDLYQGLRNPNKGIQFKYLVALLLLKLRLYCAYKTRRLELQIFTSTLEHSDYEVVLRSAPFMDLLRKCLFGEIPVRLLEEQQSHVDKYIELVSDKNPLFLKALVYPGPIMARKCPRSCLQREGSPEEARRTLEECLHLFYEVPGGIDLIRERIGHVEPYECNMPFVDFW